MPKGPPEVKTKQMKARWVHDRLRNSVGASVREISDGDDAEATVGLDRDGGPETDATIIGSCMLARGKVGSAVSDIFFPPFMLNISFVMVCCAHATKQQGNNNSTKGKA
jgi:hypothetical protein